jgi:hypothetical protein
MKPNDALKLIQLYAVCLECGNDSVGGGAGTLTVTETTFHRTCKCGFSVTADEHKVRISKSRAH